MKLHFIKEQISRSDLELAVSEWKNKVIDTESDKKALWNVDSAQRVLCMVRTKV